MPTDTEPSEDSAARDAERKNIRSIWLISCITLASRLLGYARFILTIHLFSSMRWVSDALIFAFRIPNLFRSLLGEGALSAAFIPVFVKTREREGAHSASRLGSQVATLLASVGGVIAVGGSILCLILARFAGPEGGESAFGLRLTAAFIFFMPLTCLAALLGGMLQGLRRFSLPAGLSIIMNLGFLAGFAYVYWWQCGGDLGRLRPEAAYAVAVFVLVAGAAEVALQLPVLAAAGVPVRPALSLGHPGLGTTLKGFAPTALGLGLVQVNAFVDSVIAGSLSLGSHGAITYLEAGFRFAQLPLGVFGVAVAAASFPEFVSAAARDSGKLLAHLVRAVRMSAFFLLPAAAVLIAMADPIIRLTCQRPDLEFDHAGVYRASLAMILYSAGLFFYSLRQILVRAYYARGEYSYPTRVAMAMVAVNLVLNLVLIHCPDIYRVYLSPYLSARHPAYFSDYFGYWNIPADAFPGAALGEAGLALATFLTAVIDSGVLWLGMRKRLAASLKPDATRQATGPLRATLTRLAVASICLGILTWLFRNSIPYDPSFEGLLTRVAAPCLLAGGALYILGVVFPIPEMQEFLFSVFKRPARDGRRGK